SVNLILLDPEELSPEGQAWLTDRRALHIRSVLKVVPGQCLRVGLIGGPLGNGRVRSLDTEGVKLDCAFESAVPAAPRVDLLLALPRPKAMKRLWTALAALGVGRILVTQAAKVERSYFDSHVLEPAFVRGRLLEGLEQAVDTHLPRVTLHRHFQKLIEDELDLLCPTPARWMAHPGSDRPCSDLPFPADGSRVLLAIGPEGGWTEDERTLLGGHGFIPFSGGDRIWRSEWAALLLTALVQERMAATDRSRLRPSL
ncbi:MAG: RsmE family RNA methyltransferase, partial [Kiritimatiellia bacterium]|nr:RsmE family RNA methyltransferase [Kiritimatiellia bacterium]